MDLPAPAALSLASPASSATTSAYPALQGPTIRAEISDALSARLPSSSIRSPRTASPATLMSTTMALSTKIVILLVTAVSSQPPIALIVLGIMGDQLQALRLASFATVQISTENQAHMSASPAPRTNIGQDPRAYLVTPTV